ncbi:MAG: hypothetical protein EAZ91_10805 [Cytophagales bacterium]|nr:MAG: hypothetical protein EAZ91_10805 [Cytophagales bacterium]
MKSFLFSLSLLIISQLSSAQTALRGQVVTAKLSSAILRENSIGLDPNRTVKVYLPPGYATSGRAYPVLYYCHSTFSSADNQLRDGRMVSLLESGFANQVVNEFILVVADYSTPTTGCVYENSPVSGRWLDFTAGELVPFIDRRFRTLPHRNSRAVAGDFLGGRGALKLAMTHADLFSVVYALHPVATGSGQTPWARLSVDWSTIHKAKSLADLGNDGRTRLFVTICQGFLPNPSRPPFYCNFFMEMEQGKLVWQPERAQAAKAGFHLEESLLEAAPQLRSLRGLAFDWGRFDPNPDHVYANGAFSRRLEDLGIAHEAEEYRGDPWDRNWTDNGRFYSRVLPFLARHLAFEPVH